MTYTREHHQDRLNPVIQKRLHCYNCDRSISDTAPCGQNLCRTCCVECLEVNYDGVCPDKRAGKGDTE